ncbi:MAG: flagellar biosynthesis anti-sigma factor FlgM [Leptospiraceae bacterium]|nr:flagellar biosynthesis anti-sigma factor FlgM [Leptospiraceae bacterium]MDW8306365.1 flagellar biosynthesis anti-sigma factor FlgM [Leptospiraceae bacterium]
MMIDKVGGVGKFYEPKDVQKPARTAEVNPVFGQDTVKISEEAIRAQEAQQALKTVRSAPEIRQERVKEVKEKLARGEYDNLTNEIIEKVAEKIAANLVPTQRT